LPFCFWGTIAAEFGSCPTGAFLAYAVGDEATFGVVVDDFAGANTAPGNRQRLVHGVWGLVVRDSDAIWRVTGIPAVL